MATSLTKTGTSLAETSQEELQKLSQKAGMVPSTPAGAIGIGANPDQAKMAGTPAQKPARLDGPAAPNTTLQSAQRVSGPSPQAVTAPEKLERLKQLGSLNTQVEGLVQGYMQQLQSSQAALSLNTQTLGMVPEAQRAPLETALNEYKGALTEAQKEAAVVKAGQALGRPLTPAEMTTYFAGAPDQLTNLAKNVTPGSVNLRDLNLSSAGVNIPKLAADLGVSEEELSNLTLPQLNQKVEEIKQQEFAESGAAAAESMSAVGNRAKQLQGERQALGQSGQSGYEAQFDKLQQDIENAGTVKVAGQEMTIDKLLSDESLSRIVSGAAISSTELAKLRETEPALAAWVEQYRDGLTQLAKDAGLVAADVADRQTEASGLTKDVSASLKNAIFGTRPDIMTSENLAQLKADMSSSALWQAVSTDPNLRARLETNPSAAEQLKSLTADQLKTTMDATKVAEAMPVMGDLLGYTPGGILTPQQVDFVNNWKDEIAALPQSIAADKSFQDMVKGGQITENEASLLAADPTLWDDYRAEQKAASSVSKIHDENQFLEMLTGNPGFGLEDFNDSMASLKAWAATGDQKALGYYTTLQNALTGPDGVLDLNDVQKALHDMSASKAPIGAILEGKGGLASLLNKLGTTLKSGATYADTTDPVKTVALSYLKNDQRIDTNEMSDIIAKNGEGFAKQLLSSPWVPNKAELTSTYNAELRKQADPSLAKIYQNIGTLGGVSGFTATPDNVSFTINPSVIYSKPEQLPAYKKALQDAIDTLSDFKARSADDGSYDQAAASLQQRVHDLDMMGAMVRIQKEFMPDTNYNTLAGDGSTGSLLKGLQTIMKRSPNSNLLQPGLSADQIYEAFKKNYTPAPPGNKETKQFGTSGQAVLRKD